MHRSSSSLATVIVLAVCATAHAAPPASVTRQHIVGDVYGYQFIIPVGTSPNAALRIHRVVRERAPFLPRPTTSAIMMLHGDFATFVTNFAPSLGNPASPSTGISVWLAQRGIDVWGVDRRWTLPAPDGDISDLGEMGLVQEMDDIGKALAFARGVRFITDASLAKMMLAGFSRGGQLTYAYASAEAAKPAAQRHLKGIVPLDVYLKTAPEDSDIRDFFCSIAPQEYDLVAEGVTDADNSLQIGLGANFLADPGAPTPFTDFFPPGFTNRQAFLAIAARTFRFFPATPFYHLTAASFGADGRPAALTESAETVIADWYAGSPFHSAFLESADTDSLVCDQPPFAADVPLSRIRVPLLLIAAAGGYGAHALYTTTLVSSTDVSTILIQRKPDDEIAEDFGHGDILFARDAPQLAWQPLLSWLRAHE